jgi:hypothetical protein
MAYTFTDATLLSYQTNKNYLGENNFLLNTRKNISIQGILDNRSSNTDIKGVKESIDDIKIILNTTSNVYDLINVNGYALGSGIIKSISFPENNPVRIGRYNYELEIFEQNDFSNAPNNNIYGNHISSFSGLLNNFNETFDFNYSQNNTYSYNHNLTIQFVDDKTSDLILKSKNLAETLFNENLSIGFLGDFSGYYSTLRTSKNYYSESYNLINNTCSFSKQIEIDKNLKTNYNNTLGHTISFDNNGKITVQEKGSIKSLVEPIKSIGDYYFNQEISSSYDRCSAIYDSYSSKYSLGSIDSLKSKPFDIGKTYNISDNSLEYTVSYINDPIFENNLTNSYTININQTSENINTYREEGNIYLFGEVGTISSLSNFKTKYLAAQARAFSSYPSYSLSSSSISFDKINSSYGNNCSYTIERTNDQKLLQSDPTYKSLEISVRDAKPYEMFREYIIANRSPKNFFFVSGDQLEMGSKILTINGTLVRQSNNIWQNGFNFPLNDLKSKAIANLIDNISTNSFIERVSYGYDSNFNFNFDVEVKYSNEI